MWLLQRARFEKLCEDFIDQAMKIIYYDEKEMILLTDEETEFYGNQNTCHICKKEFCIDKNEKVYLNYTKKSEIIVITLENLEELLIIFTFKI